MLLPVLAYGPPILCWSGSTVEQRSVKPSSMTHGVRLPGPAQCEWFVGSHDPTAQVEREGSHIDRSRIWVLSDNGNMLVLHSSDRGPTPLASTFVSTSLDRSPASQAGSGGPNPPTNTQQDSQWDVSASAPDDETDTCNLEETPSLCGAGNGSRCLCANAGIGRQLSLRN